MTKQMINVALVCLGNPVSRVPTLMAAQQVHTINSLYRFLYSENLM